jgi:hypothetical protein
MRARAFRQRAAIAAAAAIVLLAGCGETRHSSSQTTTTSGASRTSATTDTSSTSSAFSAAIERSVKAAEITPAEGRERSSPSAAGPPTTPIRYNAGPLISAVRPVVIYWGGQLALPGHEPFDGLPQEVFDEAQYVLQPTVPTGVGLCPAPLPGHPGNRKPCPARPNPYISLLAEYSQPSYPLGAVDGGSETGVGGPDYVHILISGEPNEAPPDTPEERPLVTDKTIYAKLASWVANDQVPSLAQHPANRLYIVLVDPGWDVFLDPSAAEHSIVSQGGWACQFSPGENLHNEFDSFHSWDYAVPGSITTTTGQVIQGAPVVIIPLCNEDEAFHPGGNTVPIASGPQVHDPGTFSVSLSHEVAEAITDPDPFDAPGWASPGGWTGVGDPVDSNAEIADYCENDMLKSPNAEESFVIGNQGVPVAKFWSNKNVKCAGD